ncbi:hypothetical protein Tco_1234227, partial [Tanacetum coccineum]
VKLNDVFVTAFSEDGLSVIATKLGTPFMLDSYTSDMCLQSWGSIHDECPKYRSSDVAKNLKNPSQSPKGFPVGPKWDAVESVDNDMTCFLASERVRFGSNSLLEQ